MGVPVRAEGFETNRPRRPSDASAATEDFVVTAAEPFAPGFEPHLAPTPQSGPKDADMTVSPFKAPTGSPYKASAMSPFPGPMSPAVWTPMGTYLDHHGLDGMMIDDDFMLAETEFSSEFSSSRPTVSVLDQMLNSVAYQRADGDGV